MGAVTLESVFTAVNTIYEAAFDQERWPDVVLLLRDLFGGSRACILRFGEDGVEVMSTVLDTELNSLTGLEAVMRDPYSTTHLAMPVAAVWQRSAVIDEIAFRKRELWQDWFMPRDMHGQLVCKLASSSTANWFLDVNRGPRQEEFSAIDIDLMNKIVPHMLRAGQISRHIASTHAASALNMPFGLLLVDGNQCLLQMNETAETLLARPDGPLTLTGGMVSTSDPTVARNLAGLVVDACSPRDGATPGIGGALQVQSGPMVSGPSRFALSVAPYRDVHAYGLVTERCAAIMITEIASRLSKDFETHVQAVFKLTEAEARLAADLASGLSIAESAVRNGVTYSTARTYLDRIFRKTDTHHQSQLVAMLKSVQPLVAPALG